MPTPKLPLHEVLASKLIDVTRGLTAKRQANSPVVMELLDSLYKGKMKATDAKKIAEQLAELPVLLKDTGQGMLAKFAEEVILDLLSRKDEKKQEQQEVVAAHEQ